MTLECVDMEDVMPSAYKIAAPTRRIYAIACLILASVGFCGVAAAQTKQLTPVSIRFSWKLKGEFAPLYVAMDKGYFAAEGIDIKLGEGSSSQAALGSIVQGQDQGAWIPGVYAIQAISNGLPVKVVGLYNAAAPNVLLSRANNPITKPGDLVGKTLGHSIGDVGTTFIGVICRKNKIDCTSFKKVTLAAPARVPALVNGQVDAISVYTSNDVPILEEKFGAKAFAYLDLPKYGQRVMGASLIVSDAYLAQNPETVARMLRAIGKGFDDTIKDPAAAAKIMLKHWETPLSLEVVTKQVEALNAAVETPAGKPMGWVDPQAVEDTLDALQEANEIKGRKETKEYMDNDVGRRAPPS